MAWAVTAGAVSTGTGTSATTAAPSGVSSGDLLVLSVHSRTSTNPTTPAGWTAVDVLTFWFGTNRLAMFYRIADGTAADTPAITVGSAGWSTQITRITGHDATPYDNSASAEVRWNPVVVDDITIAENGSFTAIAVAAYVDGDAVVDLTGSGYTQSFDGDYYFSGWTGEFDSGSNGGVTIDYGAGQRYGYIIASFSPGASGGSGASAEAVAGSMSITGSAPYAAASANVSATATAGSASIAGQAASVVISNSVEAIADAGTISIVGYVGVVAATAYGAITVNNWSFEDDSLETGQPGVTPHASGNYTTTGPSGWSFSGSGGMFAPIDSISATDGHDRTNVVWLHSGAKITQAPGVTLVEGVDYRLTLKVGDRTGMAWPGGFARIIADDSGSQVVLASTTFPTPVDGEWADVQVDTGPVSATYAGQSLVIEIQHDVAGSTNQALIDNVALFSSAGGEDVGATATAGSINIAGSTPTVSASAHVSAIASAGSVFITGQVGTTRASDHKAAIAVSGSISITGQTGVVLAQANVSAIAASGQASISGSTPKVSTTAHRVVNATAGIASITGSVPVAASTAHVEVTAQAGAASLAGSIGRASAGNNIEAFAGPGSVSMLGSTGTVATTANVAAKAPQGAISVFGSQPTVSATAHVSANATAGAISVRGSVPRVVAANGLTVRAVTGSITITGSQPNAAASANMVVHCASATISIVGSQVYAFGADNQNVKATAGAASITGSTPRITASDHKDATATAGAISIAGSVGSVLATANVVVTAAHGTGSIAGQPPYVWASSGTEVRCAAGSISIIGSGVRAFVIVPSATDDDRITDVPAENRLALVGAETRSTTAPAERRVATVGAEIRSASVAVETRLAEVA